MKSQQNRPALQNINNNVLPASKSNLPVLLNWEICQLGLVQQKGAN